MKGYVPALCTHLFLSRLLFRLVNQKDMLLLSSLVKMLLKLLLKQWIII